MEKSLARLQKVKYRVNIWLNNSFPRFIPIALLFTVEKLKQPKIPSMDEFLKCGLFIYRNIIQQEKEVLIHATIWMKLENIMRSKQWKGKQATYYSIPLTLNVENRQIDRNRK